MNPSELESALKAHVEELCSSERNTSNCPEGLERAATYLVGVFQGLDYQVTRQEFHADGVLCANVEALPPTFVGYDKPTSSSVPITIRRQALLEQMIMPLLSRSS